VSAATDGAAAGVPFSLELWAAARLDLAEVRRGRWLVFSGVVYASLAAIFVLVGLRESSVLGFTGAGRVLLSLCHALVLLLPLLALTATGPVVQRAREDGSLEFLFSLPLRRETWFLGVSLVRFAALVLPLVLMLLITGLFGRLVFGEAVAWPFLWRTIGVSACLLLAFTGLGLLVSTTIRNGTRGTITLLALWALSVALLDFALVTLMLRVRLEPAVVFLLAGLNPVETARLALLSGVEPELATLGPVGFFLATRLGPGPLLALGMLWPAVVGLGALGLALGRFRRGDVT
jgi:ABC-2 type transport system permease protein